MIKLEMNRTRQLGFWVSKTIACIHVVSTLAASWNLKEVNDDRVCAADLHELGFFAGIADDTAGSVEQFHANVSMQVIFVLRVNTHWHIGGKLFSEGVFDGHRGFLCSDFVSQQMPTSVLAAYRARVKKIKSVAFSSAAQEVEMISQAIVDAFDVTDKAWLQHAKKKELEGGSTAVVALVSHGFEVPLPAKTLPGTVSSAPGGIAKLFVAWCGDSRAVLCRGRRGIRLSEDHKPNSRQEQSRIKAAGGHVMQDAWGTWRVGKEEATMLRELQQQQRRRKPSEEERESWFLSTSRSFGDVELKIPDPLVIAEPETRVVDLTPEDWAVLLACDGVFDVLSDQEQAWI